MVFGMRLKCYENSLTTCSTAIEYIDCLVQDYSISSALAVEILQSCTKPSILCNQRVKLLTSHEHHGNSYHRQLGRLFVLNEQSIAFHEGLNYLCHLSAENDIEGKIIHICILFKTIRHDYGMESIQNHIFWYKMEIRYHLANASLEYLIGHVALTFVVV